MNADELAKRVVDRLENPQDVPAIIWRVVPTDDPPVSDGQQDDLLTAITPDGKVICYCWRSYWDAI
jgi:hypothetical protein